MTDDEPNARSLEETVREIAERQFVTVKAVQWHLRNVYRKLDVSSRDELPVALGLEPGLRSAA